MIFSSRFTAVVTSIMAAITLAGCQPKPSESVTETEVTPTAVDTAAAETDTSAVAQEDSASDNPTDMAVLREDYAKAMTRMNNEMMIGMAYNDSDTAFAKTILALHRGAVSLAELQLKYGTDSQMRLLAQQLVDSQQQKLDISNKWLASHPDVANPKANTEAMQHAYADIVASMNYKIRIGTDSPKADLAFARALLAHQQAILALAQVQLRYGTDVEMRRLAVQLTKEQPLVIRPLEAWIAVHDTALVPEESLTPEQHGDEEAQATADEIQAVS